MQGDEEEKKVEIYTPYFRYIRPKILDLLNKINFKLIAREIN